MKHTRTAVCFALALLGGPGAVIAQSQSTDADVAAIKAFEEEFTAAFKREDVDAMAGMLTDDSVVMLPGGPAVVGKDASRAFWEGVMGQLDLATHEALIDEVIVDRDWAFVRASTSSTSAGEAAQTTGKYIHVFRRQADGSWKLARDIFNSDQ